MVKIKRSYLGIFCAVVLLSITLGTSSTIQASTPPCLFGELPLDEETYQHYMQPVHTDQGELAALPTAYDARSEGIVTPAKNQGSCGSCWAFASTGAFESHLLDAGFVSGPIDLSEQQQVSCNSDMSGCCGGSSTALLFWNSLGPLHESCFPYGDGGTSCPVESGVLCSQGSFCPNLPYRVSNWYTVPTNQFKDSLYLDGPSYWRFDVYSDFSSWYNSAAAGAVYTNQAGTTLRGGHAVLMIGWDDSKNAYLMKNSWGTTSGPQDDGTFWIAYSGHSHSLGFQMVNFDVISTIPNQAPIADAGLDQVVWTNANVILDGSQSNDPDGNTPLTYLWQQTAGPAVSLSSATAVAPGFTAPAVQAELKFSLVVTDSRGMASDADEVIINVIHHTLYLPVISR